MDAALFIILSLPKAACAMYREVRKRPTFKQLFVGTLSISMTSCALILSWKTVEVTSNARSSNGIQASGRDLNVSVEAFSNKQATTVEEPELYINQLTVGVVSSCLQSDKFGDSVSKQSLLNKQQYCDEHDNVYCHLHNESLDERFSPHWNKFPLMLSALKLNDFAVWMDCDAIFLDMSFTFEQAGVFDQRRDLIFTSDANGINTGVFAARRTNWTQTFLSLMYDQRGSVDYFNSVGKGIGFVDQAGLKILCEKYYSAAEFEAHTSLDPKFTSALNNYCTTGPFIHHRVNCNSQECDTYFTCVMTQIRSGGDNFEATCAVPQHLKNLCATQKECCHAPKAIPERVNEPARAKTTLVLMSFSPARVKNLVVLFKQYGSMIDVLDRILFIWNNAAVPPPEVPKGKVEIVVWLPNENSMVNRYRIESHVQTSSVLTVDDDVLLAPELIREMVDEHERFPTRIIGTDARGYNLDGKYLYDPPNTKSRLLVIGKSMVWHKMYAREYLADEALVLFTHTHPCEDVAMNFLVWNRTRLEPVIVQVNTRLWRKDLDEVDGMSKVVSQGEWTSKRNECVSFMLDHFHVG